MKILKTLLEMYRLPQVSISLPVATEAQRSLYASFTKAHPRLRIIKNKTWGVELINVNEFESFDSYIQSISGKNSAVYFARRCAKMNYMFSEFDPNERQTEILDIHQSAADRQGRGIDGHYMEKLQYPIDNENKYYGVILENSLVAYVWVRSSGVLSIFNRIMGHNDHLKNNVMYLLSVETMKQLFANRHTSFVMYDTFFGATDGLRMFKKRIGFKPYRVTWARS